MTGCNILVHSHHIVGVTINSSIQYALLCVYDANYKEVGTKCDIQLGFEIAHAVTTVYM